jgi:hypothetical protein
MVPHQDGGQRGAAAAAAGVEFYLAEHVGAGRTAATQVADFSSSKTLVYVVRVRVLNAPMASS